MAKRILAILLLTAMILGIIPGMPEWGEKVYAADSESSLYMRFETNYVKQGLDGSYGSYRIWGTVNGSEKQTTYANEGWRITLKDAAGNKASVGQIGNGSEKIVSLGGVNYGITLNLSLVNNGRYVKVEFAVRNTSDSEQVLSIGSGADIQIGSNDSAPITQFADGSGFYMSDGAGAQFNFIGKNAYGVTNVDTFWYGRYLTIEIPEHLLPKDGETRKFSIIRVHNGVATILEDLDDVLNTITIRTDCFSTYAIVYTDKATGSSGSGNTPYVMACVMVSVFMLLLVIARKRRKKAESN